MNASIDDQQVTEGTVIGALSRHGDTKPIVKIDVVGLDHPSVGDSLDQQVQGVGNHFPEPAQKIVGMRLRKHRRCSRFVKLPVTAHPHHGNKRS